MECKVINNCLGMTNFEDQQQILSKYIHKKRKKATNSYQN